MPRGGRYSLAFLPAIVMRGGARPRPNQVFFDKEWLTVDSNPESPSYGRAYVTASRFLGGPAYKESPIYMSYSRRCFIGPTLEPQLR